MGNEYGKTALGRGFKVTGVEEYFKKIEALGKKIEDVVIEAVEESVKPILADMKAGAERHEDSGQVIEAIEVQHASGRKSNYIYAYVGIDLDEHPEAIHAVYQEYGDSHSPRFPDPFIRPAFDNNIKLVKSIQKKVLKRAGVPVDK